MRDIEYLETYPSYRPLCDHFYPKIKLPHLIDIAFGICKKRDGIPFPSRDEYRRKDNMLLWFDTYWELIKDLVYLIIPIDAQGLRSLYFDKNDFHWRFEDEFNWQLENDCYFDYLDEQNEFDY